MRAGEQLAQVPSTFWNSECDPVGDLGWDIAFGLTRGIQGRGPLVIGQAAVSAFRSIVPTA